MTMCTLQLVTCYCLSISLNIYVGFIHNSGYLGGGVLKRVLIFKWYKTQNNDHKIAELINEQLLCLWSKSIPCGQGLGIYCGKYYSYLNVNLKCLVDFRPLRCVSGLKIFRLDFTNYNCFIFYLSSSLGC